MGFRPPEKSHFGAIKGKWKVPYFIRLHNPDNTRKCGQMDDDSGEKGIIYKLTHSLMMTAFTPSAVTHCICMYVQGTQVHLAEMEGIDQWVTNVGKVPKLKITALSSVSANVFASLCIFNKQHFIPKMLQEGKESRLIADFHFLFSSPSSLFCRFWSLIDWLICS